MSQRYFLGLSLLFIVAVITITGACSFTTAHVAEAYMCLSVDDQNKPVVKTDKFPTYQWLIHCSASIANVPSSTVVKAVWSKVGEGEDSDEKIADTEISIDRDTWIDFTFLTPITGLPEDTYKVDLYVQDKLDRTLTFTTYEDIPDSYIATAVLATAVDKYNRPSEPVQFFTPDTPVMHCATQVVLPQDEKANINAQWYQLLDAKEYLISESPVEMDHTGWIDFTLTPSEKGLPEGIYRIVILVDGKPAKSGDFEVKSTQ
ncbi:MAG: hypothetical protein GXO82_00325 [Chlorobi bacterium]|nr:hypothetical protein [Chlorobiota bacterium]